jgi:protein-L-isoaspartate O-methyltransferase
MPKNLWMPILQGPMKGMRWISGSGNAGCWLGSYELANQRAQQRVIKPGMTVFDIGAHVGFYTLLFSTSVGSNGRVFAFEPFAENVSYLLRHIKKNNCRNITACQAAVSDKSRLTKFTIGLSSSIGTILETQPNPVLLCAGSIVG